MVIKYLNSALGDLESIAEDILNCDFLLSITLLSSNLGHSSSKKGDGVGTSHTLFNLTLSININWDLWYSRFMPIISIREHNNFLTEPPLGGSVF